MKHIFQSSGELYTTTYDILEKLTPIRNKIRIPMILDMDTGRSIIRSFLIISAIASKPWSEVSNEARWKVSLNNFTITRLIKPYSNTNDPNNRFHAIFVYDLKPIIKILGEKNSVEIIYSGSENIYIDQVTLATIFNGESSKGSISSLYIGPAIINPGSSIDIDIEYENSIRESVIRIFASAINSSSLSKAEIKIGNNSHIIQLRTPVEYTLKFMDHSARKIYIYNRSQKQDSHIKINWLSLTRNKYLAPKYFIENIEIDSKSGDALLVKILNKGDLASSKLHVVLLYKGVILGRSTISNPSGKELLVKLPLTSRIPKGSNIIVRAIWKWMGDSEYTQLEYRL